MIQLRKVSLQRGAKSLLENAELTVYPGQRWGIIGPNGSGKSTLFQVLLGTLGADQGEVARPAGWQIAYMAQETDSGDSFALQYVMDGDQELRDIRTRLEEVGEDGVESARLHAQMEAIDGYTAQTRAAKLLNGLGFQASDELRSVPEFSGGWRIRLNLARALMCRSDCMLLDEPTNHLDLDATLWLEQYLRGYAGTLIIISHDRDFLDNVVDGIISFENCQLIQYRGNYSAFERQKAERLAQQNIAFEKQQARIAEIENFVRRFRAKATKAKQAQSRLKELGRMELIAPAHMDSPFDFRFASPLKMSPQLVSLDQADIGYGKHLLLEQIQFTLHSSNRIGLLGANGAGKSTLLKALAGRVPLCSGRRIEGVHLDIGYYAQHQLEELDLQASCALHLQRLSPAAPEQEVRNFLGGFDFHGDRVFEPIHHFSGGEKARLALAILAWQKPNLLLMDEPTNHLDLEMRHALTVALQSFDGPIVIVSHDRHLLRNTVDEFLLVDQGKVRPFDGDLDDYQKWLLQKQKPGTPALQQEERKPDKKAERQASAAQRERLKPFTQVINRLEKEMDVIGAELKTIEMRLSDSALYESSGTELQNLLKQQGALRSRLEGIESEWLEKTEEIELLKLQSPG